MLYQAELESIACGPLGHTSYMPEKASPQWRIYTLHGIPDKSQGEDFEP